MILRKRDTYLAMATAVSPRLAAHDQWLEPGRPLAAPSCWPTPDGWCGWCICSAPAGDSEVDWVGFWAAGTFGVT
jgi:hypothetical protein